MPTAQMPTPLLPAAVPAAASLAVIDDKRAADGPMPPEAPRYDPRTRALIEGPIVPMLIRLAAPNVLVMLAQTSVGLVETYFVGLLGTDALAGVARFFRSSC